MRKYKLFKYGKNSNKNIDSTSKYLQMTARRALPCSPFDFGAPQYSGWRDSNMQYKIYKNNYSKCDGVITLSYHQKTDEEGKGLALDLVPYFKGHGFSYIAHGHFGMLGMLMLEAWQELQDLGKIPKGLYLHWGGFWSHKDPFTLGWDMAHYEIRRYKQVIKL